MGKYERIENIKNLVKYKNEKPDDFRFEYKKTCNLFPYNTKNRPNFINGFESVVGAYTRCILGMPVNETINIETLVTDIIKKVKISNPEDNKAFIDIVNRYVFTVDNKLNVFAIPVFKYCLLSNTSQEKKGESDIGQYLFNLFGFPEDVKKIFDDNQNANFFEELIIKKMYLPIQAVNDEAVTCKMQKIKELYLEDVQTLAENEEFFLKYYPKLLAYYYFFYVSQLSILINRGVNGNVLKQEKVYFLFDQEKVTKSKKAYTYGLHMIRECSRHLLANINLLAQLNALFMTSDELLPELLGRYQAMDESEQRNVNAALSEWISIVNLKFNKNSDISDDFLEKVDYLYKLYRTEKSAFGEGTGSRYALWIETSAKTYFTRNHGGYGNVLNISQEFLLMMLFVCKKGKRIKLKEFFEEMKNRGIHFDSESKLAIENKLNELNLLDKKSDSGEAAYV